MSKRHREADPVRGSFGSPKKRTKEDHLQPRIDKFFRPPESPTPPKPIPSSSGRVEDVEVIDVDLLDEDQELRTTQSKEAQRSVASNGNLNPRQILMVAPSSSDVENYTPLDVDPISYDVQSQNWPSSATPYSFLSYGLTSLSQTRSRISII